MLKRKLEGKTATLFLGTANPSLLETLMPSRKQKEVDLTQALIHFLKEILGRGPEDTKTLLLADLVVFRCRKVLLPHEFGLLELPESDRNRRMIKQLRRELIEQHGSRLKAAVSAITRATVVSLHYDLSTMADECVLVLTLEPLT